MNDGLRLLLKKITSSRRWRFITRSRQVRWLSALSLVILALVIVISIVEVRANDSFDSFADIFYWALITITTVGYGDITPKTTLGQFFTVLMVLLGVVLVSFMTATIASILTATRIREGMGLKKVDLDGHIVICGYNFKIESVIRSIISVSDMLPPEMVLVNTHPEADINDLIERFPEAPIRFVHGDYTLETALVRASISKASSAIILADPGPDNTEKPDDRTLIALLAI
ncbi:MAG: ion transporter, partial [Candidatus Latescibacteria bacterium]|nr:ion transporter [Candidatus Latescibacterota bacterium]